MRRFKNNYAEIPHPYMVEVYVAVDWSEALSCTESAEGFLYAGRHGEGARLELAFSRYEVYEEKI
jgi:hypothetical protein